MLRALALAGGIAGAGTLSQYPEFTAQYQQRLGGAVDALAVVVADFDASALALGMTRDEALAAMRAEGPVAKRRSDDMARTIDRHAWLADTLARIERTDALGRVMMPQSFMDPDIARAALTDFSPALPLSLAGLVSAVIGFVLGSALVGAVLSLLRRVA